MSVPRIVEDKYNNNNKEQRVKPSEDQASSLPLNNAASTENQSSSPLYYSGATNTTTTNNGDRERVVVEATPEAEVSHMPGRITLSSHRRNVILASLLLTSVVVVLGILVKLSLKFASNSATKVRLDLR